ncbi:MAG: efflux RND transporter periplasmic adaptor subunit [Desulfobulbaceae bacterium]|nr:efflux RND transporter periplasmic adaptor subunit [Desulfobulbaceae bacterium]
MIIARSVALAVLTGFLTVLGCSNDKKEQVEQPASPPLGVEVVRAQRENVPIWIEYTGKTEASQRVEVRARVAGRLEEVLFTEGDVVQKGTKLFSIEKNSYEAAVEQARARLESDLASLKLAKADVERYKPLVVEGLAPRVNLEQNEARVGELNAAIKADESMLADAQLNLGYTNVLAPISGRISRKHIDVGNIVGFGEKTLLTTIIGDDPMYAYFNPNEEQYQIVQQYKSKEVLDAMVTVPNNYKKLLHRDSLKGVIDFKDNRVDPMTGTISMRATVANPQRALLEGTFVYVEMFVTDKAKFLMVTPSAIQEDQRGSFVYVVDESSSAKRLDVVRGFETRHYAVVAKGLEGGESIIVSGLAKIRPGTKVEATDVTDTKGVMALMRQNNMIADKE